MTHNIPHHIFLDRSLFLFSFFPSLFETQAHKILIGMLYHLLFT